MKNKERISVIFFMAENFINPIMMSFGLLDGYRELLVENLRKAGFSE